MMKRVGLTAAAILIALSAFFVMYSFRLQSKVQLWDRYNIVYISTDYPEETVFELLLSHGAEGIISKENSLFNVRNNMLPTLAPYNNDGFTSENMRSFFFRDKSDAFFLFYIPEENLENVVNTLNKEKIAFGIDAAAEYPVLCPIICFAAFVVLMIITKIDIKKCLCLLPLTAVSYAMPFYSVSAAIYCFLFVFCIVDLYHKRKGSFQIILKKIALYLVLTAGIAASVLSGLKALLLIISGLFFSSLLLHLRSLIEKEVEKKAHFQPVYIISARWINEQKRFNLKTLITMLVFSTCFLICTLFSDSITVGINRQDLLLPSPSEYTEEESFTVAAYAEISDMHNSGRTPDLTDFLNEKWYSETAAYRKVNSSYQTAEAGDKIILPSFDENEGKIIENDAVLFCFDDSYISSAVDIFKNREGIEKLLVSEDCFFTTGYTSTGKTDIPAFTVTATVICALCFLIITLLYKLKRHIKW